jgi:competence protein ComEC
MQLERYALYVFTLGVVVAAVLATAMTPPFSVTVIATTVLAVIAFAWRWFRVGALRLAGFAVLGFVVVLLRVVGGDALANNTPPLDTPVTDTFIATVVREPVVSETAQQIVVRIDAHRVQVFLERYQNIQYGDRIRLRGTVEKPESFVGELGREFPYAHYLAARGVHYIVRFPESVEVVGTGAGNPVLAWLYTQKHAFQSNMEQALPEPAAGLGQGLLLGVEGALGARLEESFRTTGLIHIVVLSGYNVMLVVAFIQFIAGRLLGRFSRMVASVGAIIVFAVLVGLSATVVRATIMAGVLLVAQYFGRPYVALRGLCIAGSIMVILNPMLVLYDIGFQLSFMATLGMILVVPQLETFLMTRPRTIAWSSYFIATLATQIAVLPLLLYHIGEFSLIAPLANTLVLPAVPFAMLAAFLTGTIGAFLPSVGVLCGLIARWPLEYITTLATYLGALPFASFMVPPFSWGWVVGAYGIMAALVVHWYTRSVGQPLGQNLPTARAQALRSIPVRGWRINAKDRL